MPDVDGTQDLRAGLTAALGVQRWVDQVLVGAPYSSQDDLVTAALDAEPLTPAEIDEALAHHPRIGERPVGAGAAQEHSRREQSSADSDDPGLSARLVAGNAAYEQRFGRIFLIRAADRTRAEIVAELERRLTLDDAAETAVVGRELRDIAVRRLRALGEPL
ncbi:2-oxo-4-hydroxy-4-carboxy-5-ureidoimidazoline decarboxylase [Cellulomonas sp. URHB0016]